MSSSEEMHIQKLKASSLPIKAVTIYNDRAELLRTFNATLRAGANTILVTNVSPQIDSDSIRVDGRGAAVIQEVQYKREAVTPDEADSMKV